MSAERVQRRHVVRRLVLVAAVACTACLGTDYSADSNGEYDYTSTRYIDRICADGGYELTGSARRTTGLTEDSCGFALGPEPGAVTFQIVEDASAGVSVLVKTADDSFSWIPLGGGSSVYTYDAPPAKVEVVDVRVHVVSDNSCSMARHPHRRRLWW
jgi:hypothetical protein